MISSRCQMPPAASPEDVRREPGRWHWSGRTFKQSHPSLWPLLILGEETKLLPAVTLRGGSQSHSQAETWLGPQGRQSWPLLCQEPQPGKRGPALPGARSARALVAGVGAPAEGVFSLPLSTGSTSAPSHHPSRPHPALQATGLGMARPTQLALGPHPTLAGRGRDPRGIGSVVWDP